MSQIPTPRGKLTPNRDLSDLTWLRVGGGADYLFQPADLQDLCDFLSALPADVTVFPMGVGSNLIVRDGGLRAVVIRLGRGFNGIEIDGTRGLEASRRTSFKVESARANTALVMVGAGAVVHRRGKHHERGLNQRAVTEFLCGCGRAFQGWLGTRQHCVQLDFLRYVRFGCG